MAEIDKLSVGKVLDKLRRNDAPKKSKLMQLDEKAEKMDEEIQRLKSGNTTAQVWTAIWHDRARLRLRCPFGVKIGKAPCEHMFSALPPTTDIERPRRNVAQHRCWRKAVVHTQTASRD